MAVETAINAMSLIFEVAPVLISAGMVSANNSTSGPEAHPTVGGNGRSRQSGNWVLDQSTRWPSMSRDHAGKLQKTQTHFANMPAQLGFRLEERSASASRSAPSEHRRPAARSPRRSGTGGDADAYPRRATARPRPLERGEASILGKLEVSSQLAAVGIAHHVYWQHGT